MEDVVLAPLLVIQTICTAIFAPPGQRGSGGVGP
jgi:hypothetical protein